jgi:hypothetical protein
MTQIYTREITYQNESVNCGFNMYHLHKMNYFHTLFYTAAGVSKFI